MTQHPFIRVPKEYLSYLNDHIIDVVGFAILVQLLAACDWPTGVFKGSAACLAEAIGHDKRAVQYELEQLDASGIIRRILPKRGSREYYPISLCNYVPQTGPDKGKLLRPAEIKPVPLKWKGRQRNLSAIHCAEGTSSALRQRDFRETSAQLQRNLSETSAKPQRNPLR